MTLEKRLEKALDSKDRKNIEKVFEDIYNEYHGLIYFCTLAYPLTKEDREDIVNEVFFNFFNHLHQIQFRSIKYYLVKSAKNKSLDYQKKNQFDHLTFNESIQEQIIKDDSFYETLKEFLTMDEWNLLQAYILEEQTSKEIANLYHTTPSAIRIRYHRLVNKIRKKYGEKTNEKN